MLIVGIILFAVSFSSVTPLEVGIKYNDITRRIEEDNPYYTGRYFVGLGTHFMTFPSTWQLLQYKGNDLRAWTKEGQLVTLHVVLYWEFDRKHMTDFYYAFGKDEENYLPVFRDIGLRALKKVTTAYNAVDFFKKREEIGRAMKLSVREAFKVHNIVVQMVMLETIDLPNTFENQIVKKVVTEQEITTQTVKKQIEESRAQIDVIAGEGDAIVQYMLAAADAEALLVTENARSLGQKLLRDAEILNYGEVKDTVSGMSAEQLLKLRYAKTPRDLDSLYSGRPFEMALGFTSATITN
jgi:hypothetical protein